MQTQQYSFLLITLVIFIAPFLVNQYFRITGSRTIFINFLKTYSVVGVAVSLLTSLMISRGDFQFNSTYLTKINIGNLPVEVVLFFFAVPFASIALYELIANKYKEKRILLDSTFYYLFAFTYFALAFIFSSSAYTSNVFLLLGVLMIAVSYFKKDNIFLTKNFYIFSLMWVIAFIVIAAILTMTPFVTFSPEAITGFKIGSIPFEGFFHSFLVISAFLTVYNLFKRKSA